VVKGVSISLLPPEGRINVVGAWDGFWGCRCLALLCLVAKPSQVVADVDGLAYRIYCPMNYG
jgi:hypothetical protein